MDLKSGCNRDFWSQTGIFTGLKQILHLLLHFCGLGSWVLVAYEKHSIASCNRDYFKGHLLQAEIFSITPLLLFQNL